MSCKVCGDKGVLKVSYRDETPMEYAVCLCPASGWYRSDVNADKRTGFYGWQVWAAREQVDPQRMYLLEDLYSPSELAEIGFTETPEKPRSDDREAALLAAGRTRKAKL